MVFIFSPQATADGKLSAKFGTAHYFKQWCLTFLECLLLYIVLV